MTADEVHQCEDRSSLRACQVTTDRDPKARASRRTCDPRGRTPRHRRQMPSCRVPRASLPCRHCAPSDAQARAPNGTRAWFAQSSSAWRPSDASGWVRDKSEAHCRAQWQRLGDAILGQGATVKFGRQHVTVQDIGIGAVAVRLCLLAFWFCFARSCCPTRSCASACGSIWSALMQSTPSQRQ